jgi:hypothetical protein
LAACGFERGCLHDFIHSKDMKGSLYGPNAQMQFLGISEMQSIKYRHQARDHDDDFTAPNIK